MKIKKLVKQFKTLFNSKHKEQTRYEKKLNDVIEQLKLKKIKLKNKLKDKNYKQSEEELIQDELKAVKKLIKKAKSQLNS